MNASNPPLAAALAYAAKGWRIFPIAPGTKKPFAGSQGFKDATTDPDIIRAWWTERPDADIGISTGSGLFVVDADLYKDANCLKQLEKQYDPLPPTYTVMTPRNGRHFYYHSPPGIFIQSGQDKLGRWLDVKGEGGYIVAPPSTFEGNSYKTVQASPVAMAPEWLLNLLASHADRDTERNGGTEEPDVISFSSASSVSSVSSVSSASSVHSQLFIPLKSLADALDYSVPHKIHANNSSLFAFARALKTLELQPHQGKFTPSQLQDAFEQWHKRAKPFLRREQSKEDYFMEFLNAYQRAKYPYGGMTVPKAWALATSQPLPPEAAQFENPKLKLLVALCLQLQMLVGDKPFYLSSRVCQTLLEQESHSTAAKWLKALCALQLLKQVEQGTSIRAARYRYLPAG